MAGRFESSNSIVVFNKKIVIVTPWFEGFAGGAATLAKGMAYEFNRRGVSTVVFTTCSLSPYDSWWKDHYAPGVYEVAGVETRRFATNKVRAPYDAVIEKIGKGRTLTSEDEENFFTYGINSSELIDALAGMFDDNHEIVALPYFQGLTYSVVNKYPGKISLIPCFHDEPQFYWRTTKRLLANSKHIFYNSHEEKAMTIRQYGSILGRRVVEGVITGVGVELSSFADDEMPKDPPLPVSYFVYAGRKESGKNVPLLCEWFTKYASQTSSGTRLIFLGGGDKQLLPQSKDIIDLGFVSEAMKQRVIRGAKGLINLSNNESFSIVIMEGWLLGVPAIVSAQCAVTTGHVRRCNGGLYVETEAEFLTALDYLERDDALCRQLGANGRTFASLNFSFDTVLAKYLNTFSANGSAPESAEQSPDSASGIL